MFLDGLLFYLLQDICKHIILTQLILSMHTCKSRPNWEPCLLRMARSRGMSLREGQRLWTLSTIRAVLIDSIPDNERKRRRYSC